MTQILTNSPRINLCNSLVKKMGYCKAKVALKEQYGILIWLEV